MKTIPGIKACTAVMLVLGMLLLVQPADPEPVRKKILDTLEVHRGEALTTLRISLTTPVRYVSHFPYDTGRELRIRIRPFDVSRDNREALPGRETLVPSNQEDLPLDEVVYEGDIEGGPYLTLNFDRFVDFWVVQGRDSRSIVVYLDEAAEATVEPEPGAAGGE